MDDKLQNLTVDALRDLLNSLKDTKAFVLDQAPQIAREIVMWGRFQNGLGLMIGTVAMIVSFFVFKKQVAEEFEAASSVLWCVFAGVVGVIGCVMFLCSIFDFVEAFVAPKLFIIEYLSHLMNPHK